MGRAVNEDGFRSAHHFFMSPGLFKAHNESDTHRIKSRSTHPTPSSPCSLPLAPCSWRLIARLNSDSSKKSLFPGNPKSAIQNPKSQHPSNKRPLNPSYKRRGFWQSCGKGRKGQRSEVSQGSMGHGEERGVRFSDFRMDKNK